ncbi:hypothetical protein AAG570_009927 [Ranatra chinensis]|uniref:Uncharacterized protein n=1 Tax=Ranatra chinensis TaxID=642074 RepID=A0ABD0Z7M0_9HEMI
MFFAKYRDKLREGSRRNAARHELNRQLFNVELGVDEMRREAKRYQAMRLKAGTMCRKCVQDANIALARNQASRVLKLSNRAERYMELSERLSLIACEDLIIYFSIDGGPFALKLGPTNNVKCHPIQRPRQRLMNSLADGISQAVPGLF